MVFSLSILACLTGFVFFCLFMMTHWCARRLTRRFPPTGAMVQTTSGRIHVTRRDPCASPKATIVLIHGASGNQADLMEPLGDRLAQLGYRVFSVDRPGHGFSARLSQNSASPACQAAAIRLAVAALESADADISRHIIVGHSWAGAVAVNFALDHADFISGVVLLSPVTHPWPGGVRWYYTLAAWPVMGALFRYLLVMPIGLATFEAGVASVFAPYPAPARYGERTGAALVLRPAQFLANARDVVGLRGFLARQAPEMATINRPVAIVTGDCDGVVLTKVHSYASGREIPGATLTILHGVGHSPHWQEPETVITAVEQVFLRSQSLS